MLQIPENITTEQFLKDVESLRLRFPVAMISEGTGFDKSTVSRYLKGDRPSINFLKSFYEWLQKSGRNVSHETNIINDDGHRKYQQTEKHTDEYVQSLKSQIALLEKINNGLEKRIETIESNLKEIQSNQEGLIIMVKEVLKQSAKHKYEDNPKRLQQELEEINKTIGAALR